MRVTNKHKGTLVVAGVTIRPGASAEVDDKRLRQWANGNAAKVWMEQGLIVPDGVERDEDDDHGGGSDPSEREQLMARAEGLGLTPARNIGLSKLRRMVAAAEKKAAADDE